MTLLFDIIYSYITILAIIVQYMVTNGHHTSYICHHAVGLLFHILPLTSHYHSKGLSLTKYDGERWFLMMMFNFRLKCKKNDFPSLPYQPEMVDYVKFLLRDAIYLEFFTDCLLKEYRLTPFLSKFHTYWSTSLDFVCIGCL